jgi:hypothetical protein
MHGIITIGEVVDSRADGFAPGDTVWHAAGWRDYAIVEAGRDELRGVATLTRLDVTIAPPEAYPRPLDANGLTAYAGLVYAGELREGDVVSASAAAGSTGSLAAQMAKNRGHRVIGSAGSDDKVGYLLDELGLDAAFNYKSGRVTDLLCEAAPDGIEYSAEEPQPGPRNLFMCTSKDLTLRGFRGSSHSARLFEVQRELAAWLREGRLKFRATIVEGLENAPEALARILRGDTLGKTVVKIA